MTGASPTRLAWVALLFLAIGLAPGLSAQAQAPSADSLTLVLRLDDIQSRSSITPRSLRPLEEVVEARGARLTYAVIPHRLIESQHRDGVLAEELRQAAARGHEIALHGYLHICQRCRQSSHEMWCTTYQSAFTYGEQQRLVRDGVALLQEQLGISPETFVPPGHITDTTTFAVLADEAFAQISTADPEGTYDRDDLANVPPSAEYTWALTAAGYDDRLNEALEAIRGSDGFFMLLLHDPFTRPGYEDGLVLDWVGDLLDAVDAEWEGRVRYATVAEAAALLRETPVAVEADAPDRGDLSFSAVYPNPAAGRVTLTFSLPSDGAVRVAVYDLLGRQVAVLADEARSAGAHTVGWTVGALPPGAYVVRLEAEGREARRVVVVR